MDRRVAKCGKWWRSVGDQEVISHTMNIEQSGKSQRGLLMVWKLPSLHMSGNRVQSLARALYIWEKKKKNVTWAIPPNCPAHCLELNPCFIQNGQEMRKIWPNTCWYYHVFVIRIKLILWLITCATKYGAQLDIIHDIKKTHMNVCTLYIPFI